MSPGDGPTGEAISTAGCRSATLVGNRAGQQHRANEIARELGRERFDGDRYEFQILVEPVESAHGHGERLEDVFADAITLVDGDYLRTLERRC